MEEIGLINSSDSLFSLCHLERDWISEGSSAFGHYCASYIFISPTDAWHFNEQLAGCYCFESVGFLFYFSLFSSGSLIFFCEEQKKKTHAGTGKLVSHVKQKNKKLLKSTVWAPQFTGCLLYVVEIVHTLSKSYFFYLSAVKYREDKDSAKKDPVYSIQQL